MEHAEPEVVHQLRLCIKKLRAFNKLAKQLGLDNHEVYADLTFHLRKMFKLTGQIRDTQVQIHMLDEHEVKTGIQYPELKKWLVSREKKRISRLTRSPRKALTHSTEEKSYRETIDGISHLNDKIILESADKVLNNLYLKSQKLATGNISDVNLHRIRKLTKQIRYILNVLHCSYPDYVYKRVNIASLREIEAAAGDWHDNLIRIELLGRFLEKLKQSDNPSLLKYQQLVDECSAELETFYNSACEVVKGKLL